MILRMLEISRCADCPHHFMAHLNGEWRLRCHMKHDGGTHDDPYSIPTDCPLPKAPKEED